MAGDDRKEMIRFTGVDKVYRLGQINSGTLRRDLESWWALKRGREDPNRKIGQEKRLEDGVFYALKGIDLSVRQGERLGIIGGNGAGKSTLLKLISRVTVPTAGKIDLYGRVTSMLEVGTGFNGEMTGLENIYMNGAILGMTTAEIDDILEEIIDFSEIREFINTPVKRYSSGMYVKLAFSVAAHLRSRILIMDEVLAVGDIAFQKKCIEKMRQAAADEDRTVLYVSHNMNTIRELCSRCIVLDEGRIVFDGDTEEAIGFYSSYLLGGEEREKNLSGAPRRSRSITGKCRVDSVEVLNRDIKAAEQLEFSVRICSSVSCGDAVIRAVVSNASGTIVGMAYSEPFPLTEGEQAVSFAFPASPLAPGGYVMDLAVCEKSYTGLLRHDFVNRALSFRVEEDPASPLPWSVAAWGSVHLEELHVKGIVHEETQKDSGT